MQQLLERPRVYIAGPYTNGDVCVNVRRAMMLWDDLWERGFAPYCPHVTHFQHFLKARPYRDWLDFDMIWLLQCEALIRIPGESSGADEEETLAQENGITVLHSVSDLEDWRNKRVLEARKEASCSSA